LLENDEGNVFPAQSSIAALFSRQEEANMMQNPSS